MRASHSFLKGLEGQVQNLSNARQNAIRASVNAQPLRIAKNTCSVVIEEFRDEVYASISHLLRHLGFATYRVENAFDLAGSLVRHSPDLVLLSSTQPEESVWLTSAKLRIIDSQRPVWIYSPEPPGALDDWLSMAGIDEIIVYGGVLHKLLDIIRVRLLIEESLDADRVVDDEKRSTVA